MTTAAKSKRKPRESETEFMEQIIAYLQLQGWFVHHVRPGFGRGGFKTQVSGNPGFPDIVAAQGGRVAFIEVKAEDGALKPHQVEWLNRLMGYKLKPTLWDYGKDELPAYAIRGNDTGWDVLGVVVRPRHWNWILSTFAMEAIQ